MMLAFHLREGNAFCAEKVSRVTSQSGSRLVQLITLKSRLIGDEVYAFFPSLTAFTPACMISICH